MCVYDFEWNPPFDRLHERCVTDSSDIWMWYNARTCTFIAGQATSGFAATPVKSAGPT